MLKIGLTGPIGSGKSYVSNILRAKGYSVYDSDSAAKRLVESSERVRVAVVKLLGEGAYDGQGAYQRSWVAAKVFSDRALLEGLNAIVHPAVFADFAVWALLRQREGARIVFFESALLPSVRRDYLQAMDYVVCVRSAARSGSWRAAAWPEKRCFPTWRISRMRRPLSRWQTSRCATRAKMIWKSR